MKRENGAILSVDARRTFFFLFIPLLDFVNRKYGISDVLSDQIRRAKPDLKELKKAADALWKDPTIIDEYIIERKEEVGLGNEHRHILESWRYPINGVFVLERHLSRGSVFIDTETKKVYQVKGLTQSWEEMIPNLKPPFPIDATLLPYNECIISDGLVAAHHISFGPDYREEFKHIYDTANYEGKVLTTLSSGR